MFRERVNKILEREDLSSQEKIKLLKSMARGIILSDWESYREETANIIAEEVIRFLFPYPNCKNEFVQELTCLLSSREIFKYCSKENQDKIGKLLRFC